MKNTKSTEESTGQNKRLGTDEGRKGEYSIVKERETERSIAISAGKNH